MSDKRDSFAAIYAQAATAAQQAVMGSATGDGSAVLDRLAAITNAAATDLREPMRVAVAGQVKRGKSTLVNALLRDRVAPTGSNEQTFNLHEFRFSETESCEVHFRGGRQPLAISRAELHRFGSHDSDDPEILTEVARIIHYLPNELLKSFRLIDTPGLASAHVTDSANAELLLAASDDTVSELGRADAIMYMFSRNVHDSDEDVVRAFLGADVGMSAAGPLRAFGVLSECDLSWPPLPDPDLGDDWFEFDPLTDHAGPIIRQYTDGPGSSALFYTILPVAGLVAEGAWSLRSADFTAIGEIAKARDVRELAESLVDAGEFAYDDSGGADHDARVRLHKLVGAWGIHLACQAFREYQGDARAIRAHLVEHSGVGRVHELIVRHFGNRAGLIKADHAIRSVERGVAAVRAAAYDAGVAAPAVAAEIATALEAMRVSEPGFAEMGILDRYYRGELTLTETDRSFLLEIMGENGTSVMERLGLPIDAGVGQMRARAGERKAYWQSRQAANFDVASVARVLVRLYDRLLDRVARAHGLLDYPEDWRS